MPDYTFTTETNPDSPDIALLKQKAGVKPSAAKIPLGIFVQIACREFQSDFEPIIERQIHHLINYIQGVMHIGQRDIAWIRISKAAAEKQNGPPVIYSAAVEEGVVPGGG